MARLSMANSNRLSLRNSVVIWLAALVIAAGALIVAAYDMVHAGNSAPISAPVLQVTRASAATDARARLTVQERIAARHVRALAEAAAEKPVSR